MATNRTPFIEAVSHVTGAEVPSGMIPDDASGESDLSDEQYNLLRDWIGKHCKLKWATTEWVLDAATSCVKLSRENCNIK